MERLSWKVQLPNGAEVRLDDIPIEELQAVADRAGLESWFDLYYQPIRHGGAAIALVQFLCEKHEIKPPERYTPRLVLSVFQPVKDDLPYAWEEGVPLGDEPQTDS